MENQKTLLTACCQIKPEFGNTRANLEKIIRRVAETDAELVVFPELVTSGYEFIDHKEAADLAFDPVNSETGDSFKRLAMDTGKYLVLGFPEKAGDQVFNSSMLVQANGSVTIYRKLHLFDREKSVFDKSSNLPQVVDTPIGKIGLMICFDWIFPETARMLANLGAQIICHPSNLVLSFCQRAMFARSVENGVFTMTCNRIGKEKRTDRELTFTGQSQILSNRGKMLAQAGEDTEEIIEAEIEPALADEKFMTQTNHLFEDRRTDIYRQIL